MRKRLPKHIYASLLKTMKEDLPLEKNVAEVVANAMKDWALELGATHFTHWFQPMTGITAEKHDAFINPT
ncbi:glutamine synthetase III, partial [Acetobacterium tundrae]